LATQDKSRDLYLNNFINWCAAGPSLRYPLNLKAVIIIDQIVLIYLIRKPLDLNPKAF